MLRTSEVKKVFSEKKNGFDVKVTEYLWQIEIPDLIHICAQCAELPCSIRFWRVYDIEALYQRREIGFSNFSNINTKEWTFYIKDIFSVHLKYFKYKIVQFVSESSYDRMVAQNTVRIYEVNQAFRFVEGIWLQRKSCQIRNFLSEKTYFTACVRNMFWATYLSTMSYGEVEELFFKSLPVLVNLFSETFFT